MDEPSITAGERHRFDEQLEVVLAELPESIHRLLEEVPLIVEDIPGPAFSEVPKRNFFELLRDFFFAWGGLYPRTGTRMPARMVIYREVILTQAKNSDGGAMQDKLRKEIRTAIACELERHHRSK